MNRYTSFHPFVAHAKVVVTVERKKVGKEVE